MSEPGLAHPTLRPRRRRPLLVGVALAAAVVLAACGAGGWLLLSRLSDDDDQPSAQQAPPPLAVGVCVRQVAGPTGEAPGGSPQSRALWDAQKEYEPVDCADPRARSKVVALGPDITIGEPQPADLGCPDDTDATYVAKGVLPRRGQVVCVRYLQAPHPGDPGGGGGAIVTGDCVDVASSNSSAPLNDQIFEEPCVGSVIWFARIVAMAADAAGCPAQETLSRLPLPGHPAVVLCLAQGDGGTIAKPGECLRLPYNYGQSPERVDCGSVGAPTPFKFEGFAKTDGTCPGGARGRPVTGYDRVLCGRFTD